MEADLGQAPSGRHGLVTLDPSWGYKNDSSQRKSISIDANIMD